MYTVLNFYFKIVLMAIGWGAFAEGWARLKKKPPTAARLEAAQVASVITQNGDATIAPMPHTITPLQHHDKNLDQIRQVIGQ